MNAAAPQPSGSCRRAPDASSGSLLDDLRIERSQREPSEGPRWRWWTAGALVALAGTAAIGVYDARGTALAVSEATAVPASAESAPAAILQASGYVTAARRATVSAQITGELSDVLIDEGQHVRKGQVLARLDDRAQQAALAQAGAQLQGSLAVLRLDESQLAQARRDLRRAESLIGQHLISEESFETSRTRAAVSAEQVDSQRRQVQLAAAGVRAAREYVDNTIIRAPFSGVITDKAAQTGEIVSPMSAGGGFTRTGIATVVDMRSLEVDVDVNESYLHRVRSGQPAAAVLDAYPHWSIPAHVIAIVPTADRSKATVKVRVALGQSDPRILPDMGVRVSFLKEGSRKPGLAPPGAVWVPDSAIARRDGRSTVFIIQGDRAVEKAVTPVLSRGGLREIEGIPGGTRVVLSPPARLDDGARVTPKSGSPS